MAKAKKDTKKKAPFDIYQAVTDRIITQLKNGVVPWRAGWVNFNSTSSEDCAVSYRTGKPYSFLNQMLLGAPGEYVTFQQAKDLGGHVKKGAKSSMVVFWKTCLVANTQGLTDDDGNVVKVPIPVLKYYNVFSIDDCEGLERKYVREPVVNPNPASPDETAEQIVSDYLTRTGVKLIHCGNRAFYQPADDSITVPELEMFTGTSEYYSTLFHELTHSTGHSSRLKRDLKGRKGSSTYAREELVAEIGASGLLLMTELETPDTFANNAAYIKSWVKVLKEDKKAIVMASGRAQKAVNLILNVKENAEEEPEDKSTQKSA